MRQYNELLNVVNADDQVIGQDTRESIHKLGLLHREIWVWIYNTKGEIVFQRRASEKDTYPNLLDASVGGHVDLGMDYESTALKELEEETGIRASKDDLIFLGKMKKEGHDKVTGRINNVIRAVYLYQIKDGQELTLEKGKAIGLEFWSMGSIRSLSESERDQFIPAPLEYALGLRIP